VHPAQAIGRVRVCTDECYVIDISSGTVRGRRAASCLLMPEVGDTVAWLNTTGDEGYIFAVIERGIQGVQRLSIRGDAVLDVEGGSLAIRSRESLHLQTRLLSTDSEELRLTSQKSTVIFGILEGFGDTCRATLNQLQLIGKQMSSVFERVTHTSQHSQRFVEGMDMVQANTMDYRAQQLMSLESENVLTNGSRLVKTRGGQIHLG